MSNHRGFYPPAKNLPCQQSPPLSPSQSGVTGHSCDPHIKAVEAGGAEVQGHLWLHRQLRASLGNLMTLSPKRKSSKLWVKMYLPTPFFFKIVLAPCAFMWILKSAFSTRKASGILTGVCQCKNIALTPQRIRYLFWSQIWVTIAQIEIHSWNTLVFQCDNNFRTKESYDWGEPRLISAVSLRCCLMALVAWGW